MSTYPGTCQRCCHLPKVGFNPAPTVDSINLPFTALKMVLDFYVSSSGIDGMDLKNSTQKVWSGEYHRNPTANWVVKKDVIT